MNQGLGIDIVDLHSDLPLRVLDSGVDIAAPGSWPQTSLPNLRVGGVAHQVFAIWLDPTGRSHSEILSRAAAMLETFTGEVARHAGEIAIAHSISEAQAITASGRIAAHLWLEGGSMIVEDLARLAWWRGRGIRGMTLTWTGNLPWVDSSTDAPRHGLTDFGRDVVREMNRLGMVVDLAHVSDQACFQAIEVARAPVVISHACCRALNPSRRNVPDELLKAVAANGGVLGVSIGAEFLDAGFTAAAQAIAAEHADALAALAALHGQGTPAARLARRNFIAERIPESAWVGVERYLDHVEHVIGVAGDDHVALGSDFDGIWAWPRGLENASGWRAVAEGLRARGHSEAVVRKTMGENALRVFGEVEAHAA